MDFSCIKSDNLKQHDITLHKNNEWHCKYTKHKCWTNIFMHYIPKLEALIISHKNKILTIVINTKIKKQKVLKQKNEQQVNHMFSLNVIQMRMIFSP